MMQLLITWRVFPYIFSVWLVRTTKKKIVFLWVFLIGTYIIQSSVDLFIFLFTIDDPVAKFHSKFQIVLLYVIALCWRRALRHNFLCFFSFISLIRVHHTQSWIRNNNNNNTKWCRQRSLCRYLICVSMNWYFIDPLRCDYAKNKNYDC